ncbi:MAG: glycosyltransferase [bacterium]|nr:glycosyltransferase [bacterium]
MRVLHLLHSLRRGGLERVVVEVANGLARRGLVQGVCCLHQAGPLIDALDPAVDRFVFEARPNSLSLPWKLRRLYRRFRPDVIHTVDFCSWPDATAAALGCGRLKRMHSFHGFVGHTPRRYRLVGAVLTRLTHQLHAVSNDLADRATDVFRCCRHRIAVIPNGVDVDEFDPARIDAAQVQRAAGRRDLVCVTVASMTPAKNPLLLVEAARRVGPGVRFVWVGDGPLRSAMVERINRAGLGGAFTLVGSVDDVRPHLAKADVFVLPSDTEAAPLSVLEAMAMQLPVVATRTGSIEATLRDAEAGLLVEPGDAGALADVIRSLANAPGHRRRMGIRGRSAVVQCFSVDRMLDGYQQAYERLVQAASVPNALLPVATGA